MAIEPKHLRVARRGDDSPSVVCFGASAGGLPAYAAILSLLPADTGLAYIIVNHQPESGQSLLLQILPRKTAMQVALIADGETVQPNHVYVVPPGMQVTMNGDAFQLTRLTKIRGWPQNITVFLRSLARERQKNAIAVILSGLDSDGAAALKSIKEGGGLVFAQDFNTAEQPDMPKNAVKTGWVDQLLSPPQIAAELARIGRERAPARESSR